MDYFAKKQWIRIAVCAVLVGAIVLGMTGVFSGAGSLKSAPSAKNLPAGASDAEMQALLRPDTEIGHGPWVDVSGLIAPRSEVARLMDDIESGAVADMETINARFRAMHANYYTYEWTWAYDMIHAYYGIDPACMTKAQAIEIVRGWKEAVVGLDRMVYEDARKEFSLSAMTGFGADGAREDKEHDFQHVRGDFESNPFVRETLAHIERKTKLGDELIGRLE